MKHLSKLSFILLLTFLSCTSWSQTSTSAPGYWLMYFGQNKISENFSVHSEVQYRVNQTNTLDLEQLLIRVGLNYMYAPNFMITSGYGYIDSRSAKGQVLEHRIWEQFILRNQIGRVGIEHRYRIEQRWIDDKYANRLRYRIFTSIPLNNTILEAKTFFLAFYNEVFINGRRTYFDQNRAYLAAGYQIGKSSNIQVGMLHQAFSRASQWNYQIAYLLNLDLRNTRQVSEP